jgi:hypothetical protein
MCIFIRGFRVSIRVSGIREFGFGDGFPPESISVSGSGFDFGFRFWMHGDSTRSKPDVLPSLATRRHVLPATRVGLLHLAHAKPFCYGLAATPAFLAHIYFGTVLTVYSLGFKLMSY